MLCRVPINNLALGTLPPDKMKGASDLYNLTRNPGGAVGLAVINTVLTAIFATFTLAALLMRPPPNGKPATSDH
jgi:hypothetical protein